MKYIKSFLVLAVAVLGVSSVSVMAQRYERINYTSPSAPSSSVEKKVFKEITMLPYYGVFDHIAYKVEGDTVTLYGKTVRGITKNQAESSVKHVSGVKNVVNNIDVLPASSFDSAIRYRTLQAFSDKGLYRYLWEPNPSVRIVVENGNVTLEGYVANRSDANLMNVLANGVSNVFNVKNNLVIGKEANR